MSSKSVIKTSKGSFKINSGVLLHRYRSLNPIALFKKIKIKKGGDSFEKNTQIHLEILDILHHPNNVHALWDSIRYGKS